MKPPICGGNLGARWPGLGAHENDACRAGVYPSVHLIELGSALLSEGSSGVRTSANQWMLVVTVDRQTLDVVPGGEPPIVLPATSLCREVAVALVLELDLASASARDRPLPPTFGTARVPVDRLEGQRGIHA